MDFNGFQDLNVDQFQRPKSPFLRDGFPSWDAEDSKDVFGLLGLESYDRPGKWSPFSPGLSWLPKSTMDIYGLYTCSYLKCILIVLYVVMSLFIILYVIFVLLDTSHVLILIEDMLISIMTHHDPSIFSSELGKLYM